MKVTMIPVVIGALGTIPKRLLKELEDFLNEKTSGDHPALLRLAMILRRVLET